MSISLNRISALGQKVIDGGQLTRDEALELTGIEGSEINFLLPLANKVRELYSGDGIDLCSIINAKSGNCGEDCAFCAQSAHHRTGAPTFPLIDEETIVARAREMEAAGAHHFDIVTSGIGVSEGDPDFQKILAVFRRLRQETKMRLCACLGTLTPGAARALAEAGVTRYNHNIETAPSFFSEIVTTHSIEDRINTVKVVKQAGMEVCCGGIIGLGESPEQRIEFAFTLRELDVDTVPVNILNPRRGTRLDHLEPMDPTEALKYLAIFRLVLPGKVIRYAGGRESSLREFQSLGLMSGVNGMLIGNLLTTQGRQVEQDLQMARDAGFDVRRPVPLRGERRGGCGPQGTKGGAI